MDRLARGLVARGVEKGDRVGIWSPNCVEWVLVQYATARIGAVLVTINPAYRTHELAYVLEQAGVSLLVAAPSFKTSDYVAMTAEAAPDVDAVFFDSPEWDALLVDGRPAAGPGLTPDEPINIQYTSGTTGFPKGATLSHRNILGNGFLVGELCGYTEVDRVCVPVPFYHCFGMVMGNLGALTHGACVVIPAPAFDPSATLQAVAAGAMHVALRRTHDVHRCARLGGLPVVRPEQSAHRDHGRIAVPGGGDEAGAGLHAGGDHLLRHDGDVAGLDPDPRRRHHRPPRLHRRPGAPARHGQGRSTRRRGETCSAARPASSALPGTA